MFGSLGVFLMSIVNSLSTVLAPIIFGAGALGAGVTWAIGDHRMAKSLLVGALIGTAIVIFAPALGADFVAAAGGTH